MDTMEKLIAYLKGKKGVYLYGAGNYASLITYGLQSKNVDVKGFVVTQRGDNNLLLELPVYTVEEFQILAKASRDIVIIPAVSPSNVAVLAQIKEICLRQLEVCTIFPEKNLLVKLYDLGREKAYNSSQMLYEICCGRPEYEQNMDILKERTTGMSILRVLGYGNLRVLPELLNHCNRETYEKQYGKLHLLAEEVSLPGNSSVSSTDINVQMYVATSHMDQMNLQSELGRYEIPLQVGAALTDYRKGCLTDDTGLHISDRNKNYCECTGLYWIWKNTSGQDYVGISHYRRRLKLDEYAATLLDKKVDLILGLPQFLVPTVKEFFTNIIPEYDWELMKRQLIKYDSEYDTFLKDYEEGHFYFSCNLCLFKREWFDKYCEFAFQIAEDIHQYYEDRGVVRSDRYMGYLFENLLSLFVMRNQKQLSIKCTEVQWK